VLTWASPQYKVVHNHSCIEDTLFLPGREYSSGTGEFYSSTYEDFTIVTNTGLIVDAVVHLPYGAYPSYVQGYYDRDNAFYLMWDKLSRDPQRVQDWLDEWVYSVEDHTEYLRKLGTETLERIQPGSAPAASVEYGAYQ